MNVVKPVLQDAGGSSSLRLNIPLLAKLLGCLSMYVAIEMILHPQNLAIRRQETIPPQLGHTHSNSTNSNTSI